jgi:iron(III) transport system substrate-binding protein
MKASRVFGSILLLTTVTGCFSEKPRVVLYCAQDKEFADGVLEQFHKKTGLEATPKFDTEADKSVSLYVELVKEKERPRCDVFWNNEPLSTIRLQRQGLLEKYDSPSAAPYPASAKDKDRCWTAFAARARVLLVNTDLVKAADRPKSLLELTGEKWKGRVAMSRPQFGTSATQAACLFEVLGPEKAKKYYQDLRANGVQISPGNKQAAEWAGAGRTPGGQEIAVAVSDTDDSLEEIKAGSHVAIIFPDREEVPGSRMGTLFLPNTVAIIRGCPNPEGARKLVDFLLSADMEKQLAEADSHQIPLNPEVKATLPDVIENGRTAHPMAVDFEKAADMWNEVQSFLRDEFAR